MAPVGKKCQHYLRSKLYDSAFSKIVENKFPSFNIAWKKMSSENVFPETNVSRYKLWFTWLDLVLLMWTCSLKANGHFLRHCCHWVISCCLDHHPRGDPCGSQLVLGMCASKKALHSLFSSMYCLVCMCTLCREQLRRDFSPRGNTPCTPPISGMVVCLSGVQRYPGIFKVRNLLFTFLDQLKRADLLAACFWSYTNITLCWVGCASAALDKPDRSNSGDCFAWFLSQVELPVEKHTTAVWGTDAWRGAC